MLKTMKEYIIATIQRAFEVAAELADGLFSELMMCVENKHLVSGNHGKCSGDPLRLLCGFAD